MRRFFQVFFSMSFAGILLMVLAGALAVATFIENDFGTVAAKELVYNALWFEALILLFSINLIGGIFQNKLIQRRKYGAFTFHLAFLVIILGACITRYWGYEGTMMIREGQSSDFIYSQDPYIQINIQNETEQIEYKQKKVFSSFSRNKFQHEFIALGQKANIRLKAYIPNPVKTVTTTEEGGPVLSLVISGNEGRIEYLVREEETIPLKTGKLKFGGKLQDSVFSIRYQADTLTFFSDLPVVKINMMDGSADTLEPWIQHAFNPMLLYYYGENAIVLKSFHPKGKITFTSANKPQGGGSQLLLLFDVDYKNVSKELAVFGGEGMLSNEAMANIEGTKFSIAYGPRLIQLPFALHLVDFQLDRYPGSQSPSSYASEVILMDNRKQIKRPSRIYMNHVLNYDGYRFFQSSYDQDEKGTILSVNHDAPGTLVTYIGYAAMALGMILSFFGKNSRFRYLIHSSKRVNHYNTQIVLPLILVSTLFFNANDAVALNRFPYPDSITIEKAHAHAFGRLLVQDIGGRIKPMNTLTSEVLRKVSKSNSLYEQNPDQVVLGMLVYPTLWQSIPMIKINHPEIRKIVGAKGKKAAFRDFFDLTGEGFYTLREYVENAYQKKPAQRSKFDNEIIRVDERVNICYLVYNGSMLKLFPIPDDPGQNWVTAAETSAIDDNEAALFASNILGLYFDSVRVAGISGNWSPATEMLGYIKAYQEKYGKDVAPSAAKGKMEISYNKLDIFKRLYQYYGLIGFFMLMILFIQILSPRYRFRIPLILMFWLLFAGFLFQTYGLVLRWYISGHAPWSNGYESMIYIGWAAMLAGIIFSRKSKMSLATTSILTALILMTAHHSWMDPQITPLVPVLKSYWLIIHVAIITASYSFLGLGALLGFVNLILMNLKNQKNRNHVNTRMVELSNIAEMSLIIGLVMLTIGTFLGGVWANESWGRYWGWDPKETWALITVLVYSFVLHMRLIPGLRGLFAFNFATLISFGSVLMTYFGVNYYLSGLHSYAQGDPFPVPSFVYYTLAVIAVVSVMGYYNHQKIDKSTR